MNNRFRFRVWLEYAKLYFGLDSFYYDRIKNKYTLHFEDGHTKTIKEKDCVIEQSVGLKDKNGNLIYEGDIVREISKKEPEWEEYITEVKWGKCGFNLYSDEDYDFEVIGNIHTENINDM